jgi:hypothetical protein
MTIGQKKNIKKFISELNIQTECSYKYLFSKEFHLNLICINRFYLSISTDMLVLKKVSQNHRKIIFLIMFSGCIDTLPTGVLPDEYTDYFQRSAGVLFLHVQSTP